MKDILNRRMALFIKSRVLKFKKPLIIVGGIIIISAMLNILFTSVLAKNLVEKYDEKYTGRKITVDWAYVNPFTGGAHLSGLKIYELKSDSVFISTKGLSTDFSLFHLFSKTIELNNITLDQPVIRIVQRNNDFNFDDLVKTFTPKGSPDTTKKPFHFNLLNIKIRGGHFYYIDEVIPVHFSIKNVDIESKHGWCSDEDDIYAKVAFLSELGTGGIKGNFSMNVKNLFYKIDVKVSNFDMNVLEQYLRGFANYGTFRAILDADLKTNGCFSDAENINISGELAIKKFHLGKDTSEDYVAFDKVVFNMNEVNPKKHKYYIDSALLIHPYFKYELYAEGLDNIQAMFGERGSNVSAAASNAAQFNLIFVIGKYIKKLAKNFFKSNYKINHLAIYNGDINFNDYTLSEIFTVKLNPLHIIADSIDRNHNRVNASLKSMIKPYGNISVFLSISPKDTGDFDLQYHFRKIPVSMFNPYIIAYTSFAFDNGTVELSGTWNVRNRMIQSVNHLVITDPRVTKRIKNGDTKWLPIPFILALVRSPGNLVDYEIPISGNLKDPEFHLGQLILDVLRNIFVGSLKSLDRIQVKNSTGNSVTLQPLA